MPDPDELAKLAAEFYGTLTRAGMPSEAQMPATAGIPAMSAMPAIPGMAAMPALPNTPEMPAMPAGAQVPGFLFPDRRALDRSDHA